MEKFLVAGLGNPGQKYIKTRHNIGFEIIDALAARLKAEFKDFKKGGRSQVAPCDFQGKSLFLMKPLEFMNNSGRPISSFLSYYKIPLENFLVIHDDLDIPFGRIKFVRKGGHGGHNGIRSIIEMVGTNEFPRLKVGIGRPPSSFDGVNYVLSRFSPEEMEKLEQLIELCCDATLCFIKSSINSAMNQFNGKTLN